jgi:hypothetical protein
MLRYKYLIFVMVLLGGCTNLPMKVDLSQSENLVASKTVHNSVTVSGVRVANKAEKTKLVNTPLGYDTLFPFNTEVEIRQTLETDVLHYFEQALTKSQSSSRSLEITIYKADGYWVWGGASKIPVIGLLAVGSTTDFVFSLKILFEIEDRGKVISSYLFEDKIVIQGSAANEDAIKETYQRLIFAYRAKLFSDLDARFVTRYF